MTRPKNLLILPMVLLCSAASATFTDFNNWTLVEDPPSNATNATNLGTAVRLDANPDVPAGVDIGYQSVDGATVATSNSGYFFSPDEDFEIAIDYLLRIANSNNLLGTAGIGFGVGEDSAGEDSAGVGLSIVNGSPLVYGTAARAGDDDQGVEFFGTVPTTTGRFFVRYDSASGELTGGVSTAQGASDPAEEENISVLQSQWNDQPLLVSFFLRSEGLTFDPMENTPSISVIFDNFEVLSGTPLNVPEPAAAVLILAACIGFSGAVRQARG